MLKNNILITRANITNVDYDLVVKSNIDDVRKKFNDNDFSKWHTTTAYAVPTSITIVYNIEDK